MISSHLRTQTRVKIYFIHGFLFTMGSFSYPYTDSAPPPKKKIPYSTCVCSVPTPRSIDHQQTNRPWKFPPLPFPLFALRRRRQMEWSYCGREEGSCVVVGGVCCWVVVGCCTTGWCCSTAEWAGDLEVREKGAQLLLWINGRGEGRSPRTSSEALLWVGRIWIQR